MQKVKFEAKKKVIHSRVVRVILAQGPLRMTPISRSSDKNDNFISLIYLAKIYILHMKYYVLIAHISNISIDINLSTCMHKLNTWTKRGTTD